MTAFQIINAIAIIAIQVLILDNVELHRLVKPLLYPLIILTLPLFIPRSLVLVIALVLGLIIDISNDSLGLHAAACVFLAYIRYIILMLLEPRNGYDQYVLPTYKNLGFSWFLKYASISILLFNTFFFFVEAFSFRFLDTILLKIILSTLTCLFLMILYQMLFTRLKSRY